MTSLKISLVAVAIISALLAGIYAGAQRQRVISDRELAKEHAIFASQLAAKEAERIAREGKTDKEVVADENPNAGATAGVSVVAKSPRRRPVLARSRVCQPVRREAGARVGEGAPIH